jgi:polyphosphate kinase
MEERVPKTGKKDQEARSRLVDLGDPGLYINRELSFLQFNQRVLEEALDTRHPLLERVKFLSIFSSNLDEFFMIRVSGLRRQLAAEVVEAPPDGTSPADQLRAIRQALPPLLERHSACWRTASSSTSTLSGRSFRCSPRWPWIQPTPSPTYPT